MDVTLRGTSTKQKVKGVNSNVMGTISRVTSVMSRVMGFTAKNETFWMYGKGLTVRSKVMALVKGLQI